MNQIRQQLREAMHLDGASAADAARQERILNLRAKLAVDAYPISIAKIRLFTEAYRQADGDPLVMRRAKAFAHVLDNIPIFIEDGELIVGNGSAVPMGVEFDCDYSTWSREEIAALRADGYAISQADEDELQQINEYWKRNTMVARWGDLLDDERLWGFMQSGIVLPPWKSRTEGSGGGYAQSGMGMGPGFNLCGHDFARVVNEGLNGIIAAAEKELGNIVLSQPDSVRKTYFLRSVILAHKAIIRFAERFADLAAAKAATEHGARRAELERIADICRRVPANPARSFHEAVQSFWFVFLMINPSPVAAAGRFDQYMYPFYRSDIDSGIATDEDALELLQCLRIKDMQINRTSGKLNRQKNAAQAKWHNWTIGGVTPTGEDATNDLTFLLLEAARRCPTPHHTLTLRVHDNTPEALMVKALEVVKTGIGLPALIGDKSYIDFLVSQGVPIEDARNYMIAGCLDVTVPGKSRSTSVGMFIVPLVFDIFMRGGIDPNSGMKIADTIDIESLATFDEFLNAFEGYLGEFMERFAKRNNIELQVSRELFPDPVRSSLMYRGVEEGRDMLDRTMPYENGALMNPIGMINVADSLTAVRKLVFEDKAVSMAELRAALADDWQGERNAELHRQFLAAPKYGNNDSYADEMATEIYRFWAETTLSLPTCYGSTHKPTAISITSHAPGGALTGATPDGRRAGECLADGASSPMRGRDSRGPTATLQSAAKINQTQYQATLMNMKFHPTALANEDDLHKLSSLVRTYFSLGGKHLQFNVVTREILVEAQKRPEDFRDLVVRMAGYSCYFTQLPKPVQDEIIGRTEHAYM